MVSASEGWAVGYSGTILHYTVLAGALTVTVSVKDATTGRAIEGAQVFLDGVSKGYSNVMGLLTITGVGQGTHIASASEAGYSPFTPIQFSVSRSTTVAIALTPQVVANTLTVQCILGTSTPIANVMVYLDGRYVGTTDTTGQVVITGATSGTPHTFLVVASGYITQTQTQTLTGSGPWTVTIYLAHR
jgi:hypothetical protein